MKYKLDTMYKFPASYKQGLVHQKAAKFGLKANN